jgi:hypothetical protein
MSTITFNTLKFAQRLEKAGATREYAEAEADALAEVFDIGTQELVTKADLERQLAPMHTDLAVLKWMVGMSLALSTGTIALLAKLFFTLPH